LLFVCVLLALEAGLFFLQKHTTHPNARRRWSLSRFGALWTLLRLLASTGTHTHYLCNACYFSPWDSSVQGGDACWEGLRIYRGKILSLEKHLKRLFRSAKALGFENVHTKDQVTDAIFRTLSANGMRDGGHIRLTFSRGEKCTSSMNPQFNVYGTTLIILAEFKKTEVRAE
jgi:hypothetical protein